MQYFSSAGRELLLMSLRGKGLDRRAKTEREVAVPGSELGLLDDEAMAKMEALRMEIVQRIVDKTTVHDKS